MDVRTVRIQARSVNVLLYLSVRCFYLALTESLRSAGNLWILNQKVIGHSIWIWYHWIYSWISQTARIGSGALYTLSPNSDLWEYSEYVVPCKKNVVPALSVGYIDLSKRRVSPEEAIKCEDKFTKSKTVSLIVPKCLFCFSFVFSFWI